MTNNTINVPRELLENIVLCYNEGEFELGTLAAECHALLSATSPAGVDGWDVAGDILEKLSAAQLEIDQQAQRIGELEGLLYEASGELRTDRHHGLGPRIDAALSAVCAAAPNIATTSEHSGS